MEKRALMAGLLAVCMMVSLSGCKSGNIQSGSTTAGGDTTGLGARRPAGARQKNRLQLHAQRNRTVSFRSTAH